LVFHRILRLRWKGKLAKDSLRWQNNNDYF
jgi:hypothetical protein